MNDDLRKYVMAPCSDAELERRWDAAAKSMQENGIDYLIVASRTDYLGGYVKWFTDLPALHDYVAYVIFSKEKEITTIWSGPEPPQPANPPAYCVRGSRWKRLSRPFIPILNFSTTYDAELMVQELSGKGAVRIGLVGQAFMPVQCYKYLVSHLTKAEFTDADDMIDHLKAIKSDEEIEQVRQVCAIQDDVVNYIKGRIEPGRREMDIFADIKYRCNQLGAENLIIMVGSNDKSEAAPFYYDHFHGKKIIGKNDTVTILIECNAPTGMYAHIGRIFTFGEPTDDLIQDYAWAKKSQQFNLGLMRPGASCQMIWDEHNRWMRDRNLPEETRIYAHGQGYDLVERPSVGPDETMRIRPRMNICPHPTVFSETTYAFVCENYIIAEDGNHECLHKTPQEVIRL